MLLVREAVSYPPTTGNEMFFSTTQKEILAAVIKMDMVDATGVAAVAIEATLEVAASDLETTDALIWDRMVDHFQNIAWANRCSDQEMRSTWNKMIDAVRHAAVATPFAAEDDKFGFRKEAYTRSFEALTANGIDSLAHRVAV